VLSTSSSPSPDKVSSLSVSYRPMSPLAPGSLLVIVSCLPGITRHSFLLLDSSPLFSSSRFFCFTPPVFLPQLSLWALVPSPTTRCFLPFSARESCEKTSPSLFFHLALFYPGAIVFYNSLLSFFELRDHPLEAGQIRRTFEFPHFAFGHSLVTCIFFTPFYGSSMRLPFPFNLKHSSIPFCHVVEWRRFSG